ncbi:MAG: MlaD family protein [Xanthomonadales bacterium]|nr:MlaD family protein [Xanthomonadales bacterium]
METRAHHVLVGAFTLGVAALFMLFLYFSGRLGGDEEFVELEVVFTEAVTGLVVGGTVQYNGIKIGEVRRLSIDPEDPSRVVARARVSAGAPIKIDTKARLAFTGLTGIAEIQLFGGGRFSPPLRGSDGRPPRIVAEESALQKLLAGGEGVVATVNEALVRLNLLLANENIERVGRTIAHLEQVAAAVAERREDLGRDARRPSPRPPSVCATPPRAPPRCSRVSSAAPPGSTAWWRTSCGRRLRSSSAPPPPRAAWCEALEAVVAENREAVSAFANQSLGQIGPALGELRALLRGLTRIAERLEEDPAGFLRGADRPPERTPR